MWNALDDKAKEPYYKLHADAHAKLVKAREQLANSSKSSSSSSSAAAADDELELAMEAVDPSLKRPAVPSKEDRQRAAAAKDSKRRCTTTPHHTTLALAIQLRIYPQTLSMYLLTNTPINPTRTLSHYPILSLSHYHILSFSPLLLHPSLSTFSPPQSQTKKPYRLPHFLKRKTG